MTAKICLLPLRFSVHSLARPWWAPRRGPRATGNSPHGVAAAPADIMRTGKATANPITRNPISNHAPPDT